MDKNNFKAQARAAKERLKSGFWQSQTTCSDSEQQLTAATVITAEKSNLQKREHLKNKLYSNSFDKEELFYSKVKQMLDKDGVVTNPIAQLVDKQYLETLSPCQQQKYLMHLSSQYQKCCQRYEKEKNNT